MNKIQDEIDALGLNQVAYAKLMKVTVRAVQRWVSGERKRPETAELYTRLLLAHPELLPEAWVNAGYPPEGPPVSKAGRPVRKNKETEI